MRTFERKLCTVIHFIEGAFNANLPPSTTSLPPFHFLSLSVSPPLVSTANVTHTVKSEFSWLPVYTGDNGFRKKQQLIDLTPLDICLKMMELNVIFFHLNYDTNTVSDVCWRMQMSKSGEICMCKSNCYRQSWICACKM